ncbi:hypothetical protein LWI29_009600 [Acer saccharum]|uniref:Uncharacterized protein n=1 Tax=Acer saccharum TaxID=4024 RepID=A0AA39VB12_ACESA|nr:hypothetical protein LWI29_009600 [Acer saccharum]
MTRMPPPLVTRCHVLRRLMASSSRRIYRNGVIVMSSLMTRIVMMKTKLLTEKNGVPMEEKKLVTPQGVYRIKNEAIQYGSKFLSNGQPGTAQNVDKSTSLARKVFRLFKFVNDLHGLISPVPQGTSLLLVLLGKSKNVLLSAFLFLYQIVWPGRSGIYKNEERAELLVSSLYCRTTTVLSPYLKVFLPMLVDGFKDVKKHTAPPVSLVGQVILCFLFV